MNKVIKIKIEVENESQRGNYQTHFTLTEMLFTDYNNLFNSEAMMQNFKDMMKHSKGFTMLTATLFKYKEGYSQQEDTVSSFRFCKKYDELTCSNLKGNKFDNWFTTNEKLIASKVMDMINAGNTLFIETLKEVDQLVICN